METRHVDAVEREYRSRVWKRVERELTRRRESRTDLARRWRRTKSTVTRLAQGELPTTLSNLESLAAAIEMPLADFIWPIVEPKNAERAAKRAARRAADRQVQAAVDVYERLMNAHLAALDSDAGQAVLRMIGELGRVVPGDLDTATEMLAGLLDRRKRQHPDDWPEPPVKEER